MFGFQRVGDLIWAAGDQRARGFLVGATAGRTTLGGEGLQHQDGHSHLLASTVPNCVAYDPGFAYELAVLVQHGLQRLLVDRDDVFFYLTVVNESLRQPSMPDGVDEGIVRGLYPLPASVTGFEPPAAPAARCTLIGSGALLAEAVAAAALLAQDFGVAAEVCSATSFTELARDGRRCEARRLAGDVDAQPWAARVLDAGTGPVLAVSDYVCALPEQIRAWLPPRRPFATLGTDGFGRSDTRAQLRRHFGVDRWHIAWRALQQLADAGALASEVATEAARRWRIEPTA
jgi:pyruvate dehydrogenase E1 component